MLKQLSALLKNRQRRVALHEIANLNDHLRQDIGFMSELRYVERRQNSR